MLSESRLSRNLLFVDQSEISAVPIVTFEVNKEMVNELSVILVKWISKD